VIKEVNIDGKLALESSYSKKTKMVTREMLHHKFLTPWLSYLSGSRH